MIYPSSFVEIAFSLATLVVSALLFRFLAVGGPHFVMIGDYDPEVIDRVFDLLMWLCAAVAIFQMFRIIVLVIAG